MNSYSYSLSLPTVEPERRTYYEKLIAPVGELMVFSAKQVISSLMDNVSDVFYITEGLASHYISDGSNEKLLYNLPSGCFFGNLSPDDYPHEDVSVIAAQRTVVYRVSRRDYLALLQSDGEFCSHMLSYVCALNQYIIAEIDNLTFNSCKTRLMRIYCSQVDTSRLSDDRMWYCISGKLTHNELAAIVGSARVTISKLINELCEDGFLRLINRKAQISVEAYNSFVSMGLSS